jgi:hypothetical protein
MTMDAGRPDRETARRLIAEIAEETARGLAREQGELRTASGGDPRPVRSSGPTRLPTLPPFSA